MIEINNHVRTALVIYLVIMLVVLAFSRNVLLDSTGQVKQFDLQSGQLVTLPLVVIVVGIITFYSVKRFDLTLF